MKNARYKPGYTCILENAEDNWLMKNISIYICENSTIKKFMKFF